MVICDERSVKVAGSRETILNDFVNLCGSLMDNGFPKEVLQYVLDAASDVKEGKFAVNEDGKYVICANADDLLKLYEKEKECRRCTKKS